MSLPLKSAMKKPASFIHYCAPDRPGDILGMQKGWCGNHESYGDQHRPNDEFDKFVSEHVDSSHYLSNDFDELFDESR